MTYRFSDMLNKFKIITTDEEIIARTSQTPYDKLHVDAHGILYSNTKYTNGAVKILKGSKCHVQNIKESMVNDKYFVCSNALMNEIRKRINKEYSFNITLDEDIIIKSLSIATNFMYGTEKSEWSDKLILVKTGERLGNYFICKYKKPTEDNLNRLRRFWGGVGNKVKEAEHSITSDLASKSNETKTLSEQGKQEMYEYIKKKEQEEQEKFSTTYDYITDIKPYNPKKLQYNQNKFELGLEYLTNYNTLFIKGLSRSGKTYMCKEIAGRYCNIDLTDIKNGTYCFSNLLWIPCYIDRKEFIKLFAKFCIHNKNTEKCLLVLNEASKQDLYRMFTLWEDMDKDNKKFGEIVKESLPLDELPPELKDIKIEVPKTLRIIANTADSQNIKQVENRFEKILDMNVITDNIHDISEYTGIKEDVVQALSDIQDEIIKEYGANKSFVVVYKLKSNTISELEDYYNNQCRKVITKSLQDKKQLIKEYIESMKEVKNAV